MLFPLTQTSTDTLLASPFSFCRCKQSSYRRTLFKSKSAIGGGSAISLLSSPLWNIQNGPVRAMQANAVGNTDLSHATHDALISFRGTNRQSRFGSEWKIVTTMAAWVPRTVSQFEWGEQKNERIWTENETDRYFPVNLISTNQLHWKDVRLHSQPTAVHLKLLDRKNWKV